MGTCPAGAVYATSNTGCWNDACSTTSIRCWNVFWMKVNSTSATIGFATNHSVALVIVYYVWHCACSTFSAVCNNVVLSALKCLAVSRRTKSSTPWQNWWIEGWSAIIIFMSQAQQWHTLSLRISCNGGWKKCWTILILVILGHTTVIDISFVGTTAYWNAFSIANISVLALVILVWKQS